MTKLALVYHQNLEHSEMSRENIFDYVERGLGKIVDDVDKIGIPINIAGQGLDWKIIQKVSPETIKKIRNSKNVNILNGFYAHTMPTMFPYQTEMQLSEGSNAIFEVFGTNSSFILVPEFDVNSNNIHEIRGYPILNEDVSPFRPKMRGGVAELYEKSGSFVNIYESKTGMGRPAIIGISGNIRNAYLGMFREVETPESVVEKIHEEYAKAEDNRCPIVAFATDIEPPWINRVIFENGIKSEARLDIFNYFHKEIKKSGMEATCLDKGVASNIEQYTFAFTPIFLGQRETEKWFSEEKSIKKMINIAELKPVKFKGKLIPNYSNYEKRAYLRSTASDTFSALTGIKRGRKELPSSYNGKPGKVSIESVASRIRENDEIVRTASRGKYSVNFDLFEMDDGSKRYLNIIHEIFSEE